MKIGEIFTLKEKIRNMLGVSFLDGQISMNDQEENTESYLKRLDKRTDTILSLFSQEIEEIIGEDEDVEIIDPKNLEPNQLGERAFIIGGNIARDEARQRAKERLGE